MRPPALLAVDAGGSKTDAVLLERGGRVIGARRAPTRGYRRTGDAAFLDQIEDAIRAVCEEAGRDPNERPVAGTGVFCLAGADLPVDERRILRGLRSRAWVDDAILRNDTFAVLRAGTVRRWGVAVVCGTGMNCAAVGPDGRTVRFPALGRLSGDWGGGRDLGEAALWHAMRARDGRGPPTSLRRAVPAHFGLRDADQVMRAIYTDRLSPARLGELAPLVFGAAAEGDAAAREVVDRQADEVVAMASAAIRRLRIAGLDLHVVLGGGVFRAGFDAFHARIDDGIHELAPRSTVLRLTEPPVLGAAMLGLDLLGAGRSAYRKARETITDVRLPSPV